MQSYYEMLGVSQEVTPSIAKIAYEGKLKALARSDQGEAEKQAEERELTKAYVTLSNPAKKDWYDKQRALHGEREERAARASHRTPWIVAGGVAAIVIVAVGWILVTRANDHERLRLEAQRIALEQEKARKSADIEEARLQLQQDSQAHYQGLTERQQAAREQAYRDQQARIAHDRAFQQQVQSRAINTFDERSAQYNEDRQRRLDAEEQRPAEAERRKAQAEVDRQKRFVADREREDERIRAERDYRVQREQALKRARDAAAARQGQ
jgi:hypothetical protein